tara:strand:- start:331 stop:573 length:243 start_codon:yes stop_codon:yes gene_type:complete
MTNKTEWQIERAKKDVIRANAMKYLTTDQLNTIKETYKALENALAMLSEMNDLYLSDIRKLDNAFWELKNEFNLGGKEDD